MAEGLPVVCYDFGGQSDFLKDRVTGRLFQLNELDSLTKGTAELISNNVSREEIASQNLKQVEDFFIDTCGRRYENAFEKVIAAHRSDK
jgi:glycosyltransferase involved in cell wall biosynthesis